ncbi:site-specific integrase [Sinimarinibacterium flocculans]|uniref:Phage integrase family protein n=2 Tax=Sinimarinibacterium flocculans TaxID=985250 RepID=A0A318E8Q9_9GAMM|nr:phage integrase family protein [Sinimarinibacterium flocculans]
MGRRSTGTVERRGKHQYRARIIIGGEAVTQTFASERDARRWIDGIVDLSDSGRFDTWKKGRSLTLGAALSRYSAEVTAFKQNRIHEQGQIDRLLSEETALCEMPLWSITVSTLQEFVMRRIDGTSTRPSVSGSTVNRDLALISHLYTVAITRWGLDELRTPVVRGLRCKENQPRDRRLDNPARNRSSVAPSEEQRLLEAALEYSKGQNAKVDLYNAIRFTLRTAVRLGELGRIEWRHVDLDRRVVLIPITKNGAPRSIPLCPIAIEVLTGMTQTREGLVFGNAESIRTAWNRTVRRAELQGLRFHDLRHEAISRLYEETDLSDMEIAAVSGHKTLSMLQRYSHLRADRIAMKLARTGERTQRQNQHRAGPTTSNGLNESESSS